MPKYVMCLGGTGRRRAMVRYLYRRGYDAIACEGKSAIADAIRERGLPRLILSETSAHVRRAREVVPRLYEVGALSFEAFAELLRDGRRALDVLLAG